MSNATLPATIDRVPATIDAATMEKVVVNGDLSKLSPAERLEWYRARCDAAGLDPRTQPFQYLSLQGKLTLYATKGATDQLIASRKLTVEIVERAHLTDLGIYEVRCRVRFPDGRHVEDVAALSIRGLQAEALCNAVMKCVTKAKRRTVLSACGLGMLDETEVETIPGARREPAPEPGAHHAANHGNGTGHGRTGAYAPPASVAAYRAWRDEFVRDVNAKWLDKWTSEDGQIHPKAKELLSTFQVSGHLFKWALAEGLINAPEDARAAQRDPFVAVAWDRNQGGVKQEAVDYGHREWRKARVEMETADAPAEPEPVAAEDVSQDADPDMDYGPDAGSAG